LCQYFLYKELCLWTRDEYVLVDYKASAKELSGPSQVTHRFVEGAALQEGEKCRRYCFSQEVFIMSEQESLGLTSDEGE
jgi:hypothetical protein